MGCLNPPPPHTHKHIRLAGARHRMFSEPLRERVVWGKTPLAIAAIPLAASVGNVVTRSLVVPLLRAGVPPQPILSTTTKMVISFGNVSRTVRVRTLSARPPENQPLPTCPPVHPLILKPVTPLLSTVLFLENVMNNVRVHRSDAVTSSSRAAYSTGWKAWCEFVKYMGTDVDASTPPTVWSPIGSNGSSWRVTCICAFLSYCHTQRHLLPSTCSTYLSGVMFHLRMRNVPINELSESQAVSDTKAGIMRAWRERNEQNAVAARSNLPFTASMIEYAMANFLSNWFTDATQHGLLVALVLGFMLCARPSEFLRLPHRTGRLHFLRGKDVRFTVRHLRTGKHVVVSSTGAHLVDPGDYALVNALPHVRHSKADQHGEGTPYVWPHTDTCADGAFQVALIMFTWAKFARPQQDMPFLSRLGNQAVSPESLTALMKQTARALNFDANRFTLRSLRYGGATQLVAIGASDSYVQLAGRWKSLAFLRYIKLASAGFAGCLDRMSDPTAFSINDIHSICTTSSTVTP